MSTSNTIERDERGKWLTSGNPAGRPKGTGNKLPTEFKDDLRAEWQRRGKQALGELTSAELVKTVASLMPKELLLELQDHRAKLTADHWAIVMPMLTALKAALPDANERDPEQVKEFVLNALRAASAKQINTDLQSVDASEATENKDKS